MSRLHPRHKRSAGYADSPAKLDGWNSPIFQYTALAKFGSSSNFLPVFLSGVYAIGIQDAVNRVREDLLRRVGDPATNRSLSPDPMNWAIEIVGAIDTVISDPLEATVGGRVQAVIGDKSGRREVPLSFLAPGLDAEVDANWREGTYSLKSLTTAGSLGFQHLASSEDSDLVEIQVSE